MTRHPGDTRRLIDLADLQPGARVLDLGAGDGDGVRLLRSLGYDAAGIDRIAAEDVEQGDLLHTTFASNSFDAVMSECTFFLTGDVPMATFVNNSITDGSACVLIKNSNGNPLSYYFTQHYQYVYVLDYRKYFSLSLTQFVDRYNIDDVLFCFSSGQAQSSGGNALLEQFIR